VGVALTTAGAFHHEAAFYAGDDEFVERSRAFIEDGLERDEPVLAMVGARKLELLRAAIVSRDGAEDVSHTYCGIDRVAARFAEPLSDPPPDAAELTVTVDALRDARGLVRARAQDAGLGERSDDFVLAVNEVLSNSLHHAHEDGVLRVWDAAGGLVCEVRDSGHIRRPMVGREEPSPGQIGGHGIWLVNLVCDLVQVRSSAGGSTVRMQMNRAA
jgi:anti-sigma regulatory factor (Ser/Thr protein kinase)